MTSAAHPDPGGRRGALFVSPALLFTFLFFAVPFAIMIYVSLTPSTGSGPRGLSLTNYAAFFQRPHFGEAMVNSIVVTSTVTLVSLLIAYPFALVLADIVPERWQRLALVMAVLPFWTSYVVRSYAWLLVLSNNGVINRALLATGLIDTPMPLGNSRLATVIGFAHFFVMLLTLTIYASLKQLPASLRKAAADLGAGPIRVFLFVTLPLTMPGIVTGAFLTFVLCIGDFVTPQILGGNNELLMPQLIMLQVGRRADFPMASALSILLMIVVSFAYLATARWSRLEQAG